MPVDEHCFQRETGRPSAPFEVRWASPPRSQLRAVTASARTCGRPPVASPGIESRIGSRPTPRPMVRLAPIGHVEPRRKEGAGVSTCVSTCSAPRARLAVAAFVIPVGSASALAVAPLAAACSGVVYP